MGGLLCRSAESIAPLNSCLQIKVTNTRFASYTKDTAMAMAARSNTELQFYSHDANLSSVRKAAEAEEFCL